jgi:Domain of unknown function (DUF4126)
MEQLNHITAMLALTMGLGWASGINLYATLLTLGFLAHNGSIQLPPDLQLIAHPIVITAAGFMYCVEFFADKIPGVDSIWDGIHTFIRIPAGTLLAANAVTNVSPEWGLAAALVGGALATSTHATKAGSRILINTSPEPFSNWATSISEDITVIIGVWASIQHPTLFLIGLVIFIGFMIWLLPRIGAGIKKVFQFIFRLLGIRPHSNPPIQ